MTKTFCLFGFASLLVTGIASPTFAANDGSGGVNKSVTGTQLGSPQENTPATGRAATATSNQTGTNSPGTVGPTGSTQPDATNPSRSSPSGGDKN
jgi:hypothetical protein